MDSDLAMNASHEPRRRERKVFGTDGIRGRVNAFPISCDFILRLGQAIGTYFRTHYDKPKILIGKDTRQSGYMIEQALSSGICSVGVDTLLCGPLPTPGIAYLTRGLRANAGIVISASHNPYHDNGIKIFSRDGYKLPDDVEEQLEELAFSALPLCSQDQIGQTRRIDDAMGQYAVFLKEQFPKTLSLEGLKIVLDCAHGAAYKVAPKVFAELGAHVILLGDQPNGLNINLHCGATAPTQLVETVKKYNADIGFGFDGDADRLVVVDHRGEVLDGDEILAITGLYLQAHGRLRHNTIVATTMSNLGLAKCLEKSQITLLRAPVGDRYVVEAMRKGNFSLGGEQSGHVILHHASTTGDGILAALTLLEACLNSQTTVHAAKRCMERHPQVLRSFAVPAKPPLAELRGVNQLLQQFRARLGKDGRVLLRYSGTEPKARVMIEGLDAALILSMADEICLVMKDELGKTSSL